MLFLAHTMGSGISIDLMLVALPFRRPGEIPVLERLPA